MSARKSSAVISATLMLLAGCVEQPAMPQSTPTLGAIDSPTAPSPTDMPVLEANAPVGIDTSGLKIITAATAARARRLMTLRGHQDKVSAVAFSSDGVHLASASRDGTIRLWDLRSGRESVRLWRRDTGAEPVR